MARILDSDVRIWPKACQRCRGDLVVDNDPGWRYARLVCFQCGHSPDTVSRERIIDSTLGKGRPARH